MKRRTLLLLVAAIAASLFAMTAFAASYRLDVTLRDASVNVGQGVNMDSGLKVTYNGSSVTGYTATWEGANLNAFSRNGAIVTGIKAGSGAVGVSVRLVSGTDIYTGGATATVTVLGSASPSETPRVTISRSSVTLRPNSGIQLSVKVYPSTFEQKVEWSSSNTSVADVSQNGYVTTYNKTGTATITAAWNGNPGTIMAASESRMYATTTVTVNRYGPEPTYRPYPPRPIGRVPVTALTVPSTLNVSVGGSEFLPVTYYPANTTERQVVYNVRDTSIATVGYNGMVTGKRKGVTDVTVYARDNTRARATCRINVGGTGGGTTANGISVNPSRLSMSVGETAFINASVMPYNARQDVTYTSSKPSVAAVDGTGRVTAKKSGTATIYVRAASNRNKYATVSVTVGSGSSSGGSVKRARGVTISPKTLSLTTGETGFVSASVSPSSANQSVTYSVGNPRIATVDANGAVQARSAGKTTVYAYSSVNNKLYATCVVTVSKGGCR